MYSDNLTFSQCCCGSAHSDSRVPTSPLRCSGRGFSYDPTMRRIGISLSGSGSFSVCVSVRSVPQNCWKSCDLAICESCETTNHTHNPTHMYTTRLTSAFSGSVGVGRCRHIETRSNQSENVNSRSQEDSKFTN